MTDVVLNKREELKKNKLDMQFRSLSQRLNAILTLGTVGILSFMGVFIWYKERLILGSSIIIIVEFLLFLWYNNIKTRMNGILDQIGKI